MKTKKIYFHILFSLALLFMAGEAWGQETQVSTGLKNGHTIVIVKEPGKKEHWFYARGCKMLKVSIETRYRCEKCYKEYQEEEAKKKAEADKKKARIKAEKEAEQKLWEQQQKQAQLQKEQRAAEETRQSIAQNSSSNSSNASSYSRTSQSGGNASSSTLTSNPYKDPALNAKYDALKRKREESRRKIAAMKAKMAQQQRDARRLDAATDRTFSQLDNVSNISEGLEASRGLAMEFARQGSAAGAYTTIGVGAAMGFLKQAQANKRRKEAAERAAEERRRIEEAREERRRKIEAERERLRREAFELLISQRHTILDAFTQQDPIPLSTTHVEGDTIYYFIYAYDPTTFDKKETNVYVSNVFAIARYHDGTWPYQSSIDNETKNLTPYNEIIHGFYLDAGMAKNMRKEFVSGFNSNEGVSVTDIAYREESMKTPENSGTKQDKTANGGLGVRLNTLSKTNTPTKSMKNKKKANSLGVPLGPAPKTKTGTKSKEKKSNSLGIPLGPSPKADSPAKSKKKETGLGIPLGG